MFGDNINTNENSMELSLLEDHEKIIEKKKTMDHLILKKLIETGVGNKGSFKKTAQYINKRKWGGIFDQSDSDDEQQKAANNKHTPVTRKRIANE